GGRSPAPGFATRWRGWMPPASKGCHHSCTRGGETAGAAIGPPFAAWHVVSMSRAPADDLPLAAAFPAATREQWRKLVEGVLKGAPFDAKLVAKTYDGLAIQPLYGRKADAQAIAGRAAGTPWWVTQRVDHPDPALANSEALHDLENGATALALIFADSVGAYGYGLAGDEKTIARALAGIHLDTGIALDLDSNAWPTH